MPSRRKTVLSLIKLMSPGCPRRRTRFSRNFFYSKTTFQYWTKRTRHDSEIGLASCYWKRVGLQMVQPAICSIRKSSPGCLLHWLSAWFEVDSRTSSSHGRTSSPGLREPLQTSIQFGMVTCDRWSDSGQISFFHIFRKNLHGFAVKCRHCWNWIKFQNYLQVWWGRN